MKITQLKKTYLIKKSCRNRVLKNSILLIIQEGKGSIIIDGIKVSVKSKSTLLLLAGQSITDIKTHCTGYALRIKKNFFKHHLNSNEFVINAMQLKEISKYSPMLFYHSFNDIFSLVEVLFRFESKKSKITIKPSMTKVILKILLHNKERKAIGKCLIIDRFLSLLEVNSQGRFKVIYYARILGVTPKTLNSRCKKLLGKSPKRLIDEYRYKLIKAELNTGNSIKEILYKYNFHDNSHFTRFFKKYTGCTPKKYKAQQQKVTSEQLRSVK